MEAGTYEDRVLFEPRVRLLLRLRPNAQPGALAGIPRPPPATGAQRPRRSVNA